MTADELARLKHDVENLDECNHNYDVELARILNAAPALIALAEWARLASDAFVQIHTNGGCDAVVIAEKLLAAYPEGE